jgi:hypothetical protein
MKLIIFYNMEKTRFGRWFMEGFPAKYHALFWIGIMTFTGPKERVSETLVKHELIHHYQAQREGWLRWNINYYRELWTVGYGANSYEVEAYARMHEPLTLAERELTGIPKRQLDWLFV